MQYKKTYVLSIKQFIYYPSNVTMWNSKQAHLSFYISDEQEDEKMVWILTTLSGEKEFIAISNSEMNSVRHYHQSA